MLDGQGEQFGAVFSLDNDARPSLNTKHLMVESPLSGALPSGQIISQVCNRPLIGPQSIITLNSDSHTMWCSLSRMRPQYLVESLSLILSTGAIVVLSSFDVLGAVDVLCVVEIVVEIGTVDVIGR